MHCFSAGEGALLNPESNATMRKSKLNWVLYTGEMFDVYVTPFQIKRLHAPLEPDLEYVTQMQCRCLHLRPCEVGLNKDGEIAAWLYCTFSGRFFDRNKHGWKEQKFNYSPSSQSFRKGSSHPIMRNFGGLLCHLLVAHAWNGKRPEGKVCDHKDTNLMNWCANNLEWVTPAENYRRAGIARKLRKIGINPELIFTNILDRIFKLPDDLIGTLIDMFLFLSKTDFGDQELNVTNLNATLAAALEHCYDRAHI